MEITKICHGVYDLIGSPYYLFAGEKADDCDNGRIKLTDETLDDIVIIELRRRIQPVLNETKYENLERKQVPIKVAPDGSIYFVGKSYLSVFKEGAPNELPEDWDVVEVSPVYIYSLAQKIIDDHFKEFFNDNKDKYKRDGRKLATLLASED